MVTALAAQGRLDLAHAGGIANPGGPDGWCGSGLASDVTAAAGLAWRLESRQSRARA